MMWLFFLQLFGLILAQNDTQLSSDKEKRLMDEIFKNYNKNILPPHNSTHPVIITAKLVAAHLHSIDFAEQTLCIESWPNFRWDDKRLQWDKRNHNIGHVRLNAKSIWRPDITLLNSADANIIEFAERTTTKHAHIYWNGMAVWIPAQTLKVLCALDMTYYPFDTHNCSIKVGSWKFDVDFKLESDSELIFNMDYLSNCTEWEVLDTYAERTTDKIYNVLSENNFHNYSYVTFSLKIGRVKPLYHAIILFPLAAGIMLAITAFLVSPFKNERIGFNVFVLFLFIFIMLQLTIIFPSVGRHTPAVVSICESLIILIALSIVWNVILLAIFDYLANTKLTSFAQTFLSLWPIKFFNQLLYKDNTCQMDANSIKVYEESEKEAIIKEQIGSTNEWQYFLFILDKLAFIIFTFLVIVILITFCS